MLIYTPKKKFWPVIDDALKTAALENQVEIKMLISYWNHSAPSEDNFLKSLSSLSNVYKKVSIEVVSNKSYICIIKTINELYVLLAETIYCSI